jgi:hypothetical protein
MRWRQVVNLALSSPDRDVRVLRSFVLPLGLDVLSD